MVLQNLQDKRNVIDKIFNNVAAEYIKSSPDIRIRHDNYNMIAVLRQMDGVQCYDGYSFELIDGELIFKQL